jgi:CRISPR-associated protein Cas5d
MRRGDLDGLALIVDNDRQQRAATILVDVDYLIEAHFELADKTDTAETEGKHLDIFNRRAERGQCFHQPCLGTREFDAAFALHAADAPLPVPAAENRTPDLGFGHPRDLGIMLWDIDHAAPSRPSMFFRASLKEGVVEVPQPGSREVLR